MPRPYQPSALHRFSWFLLYAGFVGTIGLAFSLLTNGDRVVEASTLLMICVLLLVGAFEALRQLELSHALAQMEHDLLPRHAPVPPVQNRFPGQAPDTSIRVPTPFHSGVPSSAPHRALRSVTAPHATS